MSFEVEQRLAVRDAARLWLGTPYHHRAAVLGSGVDCAQLLLRSFVGAGLIDDFDAGAYSSDWHLHRGEERYLETLMSYTHRVDEDDLPLNFRRPGFGVEIGDILMWRVGRTYSHSAIVTTWPYIIHAYQPSRIVEEVDIRGTPMAARPMRVFSYWGTP